MQRKGPRDNSPARHIEPDNDFDGPPPGFVPTPARPLPPTTAWNAAFACNLEHALSFPDLSQRAPDISRLDDRDGALAH
ncbi:MAG: hypothetical protein ACK5P8_03595, partial [Phycisphaerae bacterium]